MRCQSNFCVVKDGVRGREFTPKSDATGVASIWCPTCLMLNTQVTFMAGQTANMVRNIYQSYINTNLPNEVKLILEQFTLEVMRELGQEL
jgi:hypothetical protein